MIDNEELQKNVLEAIKWEPLLNAAEIGVTAKDGVVTLTGTVNSYKKKLQAEDATKTVVGVRAIVEKIEINFGDTNKKDDAEIATEILGAFRWNWDIPSDRVKVKVENGWITLEGELEWNYQKEGARKAVNNVAGVKGVINNISIKSQTHNEIQKEDIKNALMRNWSVNDQDIEVIVSDNRVILKGTVSSWYQRDEAGRIAWNAPGVWAVDNELLIEFDK